MPPFVPLQFDAVVSDLELQECTANLFNHGHYAQAVEAAYKFLNNLVKRRSKLTSMDGADLMRHAFSPSKPVLKMNSGQSHSERDEQRGYMDILAGAMEAIRNPRAHEHDWTDSQGHALELLCLANHLVVRVRNAEKT